MVKFFYDTEFLENGETIELISIGIVREDGREYYAVNFDAPWDSIEEHGWLMENVVPTLPHGDNDFGLIDITSPLVKPSSRIADEVRDFILGPPDLELWAYYGAYDHVALCQLFGRMIDLPEGVPMFTHELMQLWEQAGRPDKPHTSEQAHNALEDARWNKALHDVCASSL